MTIALWCVLVAALLPLFLAAVAKSGGGYDNADPRAFGKTLTGFRQRANNAQENGFEALPLFAAAVIVAEMKGAPREMVDVLAVGFIVARLAYAAAYLGNQPQLRTGVWMVSLALAIAIFVSPVWR